MDVQMPELDGIETTRRLKADPKLARIPVIALTAHAMTSDRERFLEAGMDDYLSKPIEEGALWRVLSRWLPAKGTEKGTEVIKPAERGQQRGAAGAGSTNSVPFSAGARAADGPACIDVPSALARVNGNAALLWRLVAEFRTRHADAASEMRRLLAQGRRADVQALAHTLKGAAATLSARQVADASGRIESAARHGGDIDAELEPFERAWAELAAARLPEAPPAAAPAPQFAPERALSELGSALAGNSLSAGGHLKALRTALRGRDCEARLDELGRRIEALDFDAARHELAALRQHLVGATGAS
jgi:two-component system sensor histidine kinase/response regulator